MPTGPNSRLWALALAIIVALLGVAGTMLVRELNSINTRLDRIRDYVLEHRPAPEGPP